MHVNLQEMNEYSDERAVVKSVYKGEQSEAVLLFLTPGQVMPSHMHKGSEVILTPQTGCGVLTVNGDKDVHLTPGMLYYEPAGCTFTVKNTGEEPLKVLITLVHVERDAISAE